jgi:tetratricopeptide (TPR) repeat protein
MKVLEFILGILVLPWDILLLTVDFFRVTLWFAKKGLCRLLSLPSPLASICRYRPVASTSTDGRKVWSCRRVAMYGHPVFFRMLCRLARPAAEPKSDLICFCEHPPHFSVSARRWLVLALALGLVWSAAGIGLWRGTRQLRQRVLPKLGWTSAREPDGRPSRIDIDAGTPAPTSQTGGADIAMPPLPFQKPPPAAERSGGTETYALLMIQKGERLMAEKNYPKAAVQFRQASESDPGNAEAYWGLARCCTEMKADSEAIRMLRRVLELDPSRGEAHLQLARAHRRGGDFKSAVEHARKAAELLPKDAEARSVLSACLRSSGNVAGAAEAAEDAAKLAPSRHDIRIAAGALQLMLGRTAVAEEHFRAALDIKPASSEALLGLGRVWRVRGNIDSARRCLEESLRSDPGNVDAAMDMGEVLLQRGDLPSAIALYRDMEKREPAQRQVRARLAEVLLKAGKINDAYNTASKLVDDNPSDPVPHLILADLLLGKDLATPAVEHCRKAIRQQPDNTKARRLLARALMAEGSTEQAVRELDEVLKAARDDLDAQLLLGTCLDRLHRDADAIRCLTAAAERHPKSPMPSLMLAQLHLDRKNFPLAIDNYRKAIEADPNHPVALNNLAAVLLDTKSDQAAAMDEAYSLVRRAAERYPTDPVIADTLGWIHFHRREYDKAVSLLGYAAGRNPALPSLRYRLAAALYATGAHRQAQQNLEVALALSQDFAEAGKARALLEQIREHPEGEKKIR